MFHFKNRFGNATLLPVTAPMQINQVSFAAMEDVIKPVLIDMTKAEQLALITDNKGIQICFCRDLKQAYVVHHLNANTVQICAVHALNYHAQGAESPADTLARLAKQQCQIYLP